MSIITVDRDPDYAPCCFLICKVTGQAGSFDWNTRDENSTVLVQTDYDWPGLARNFGWTGVDTDIELAGEYLDRIAANMHSNIRFIDDPGYFTEED